MVLLLLPLVAAILLFVERPPKYPVRQAPNALQERLYGRLGAAGLSGDELATVGALTLGYKEELDKELKRHFQASGAAHVLAVSGLHTGLIYGLLVWLLTLGGRFRPMHENTVARRAVSLVIIGVMWGYAWLTGLTPSVVRAVLMVTLVEIGKMIYRKSLTINTIAAAAVLILIVRPTDLWSVSFQLSFAATTAIVLMVNRLPAMLTGRIAAYFLGIIVVSVAAQLGTLPITMFYFKQVSTYFLLANLLVLPIATFLVPSGLATIALGGSTAGVFIGKITWALAWLMNHSVEWIESLPGSTISAHINGWMVGIYYILLCILYMLVTKKA
jgi:competence protein ComEC